MSPVHGLAVTPQELTANRHFLPRLHRVPEGRGFSSADTEDLRSLFAAPIHGGSLSDLENQNVTNEPVNLLKLKESIFPNPSSC
jgi:hypothetical protein